MAILTYGCRLSGTSICSNIVNISILCHGRHSCILYQTQILDAYRKCHQGYLIYYPWQITIPFTIRESIDNRTFIDMYTGNPNQFVFITAYRDDVQLSPISADFISEKGVLRYMRTMSHSQRSPLNRVWSLINKCDMNRWKVIGPISFLTHAHWAK